MDDSWRGLSVYEPEPNLTAILPGICQARCRFCVERVGPPHPESPQAWLRSFAALCNELSEQVFKVLSLSGGEPSLSPVFGDILELLRRRKRFHRVVLTTNGGNLQRYLSAMPGAITNVNISRHAVDEADNARVFRLDPAVAEYGVPTRNVLEEIIQTLSASGVLVNLNCVYSREHFAGRSVTGLSSRELRARADDYIRMARALGATSVSFRHDHRAEHSGDLTALEEAFADHANYRVSACDSCRVITKIVHGLAVNFKRSAYEPTDHHQDNELYELVFHSNGVLARDWKRKMPLSRPVPAIGFVYGGHAAGDRRAQLAVADPECSSRRKCAPLASVGE